MLVCCYSEAEATITSNVCQKIARGAPMDSRDLASWTNKIYGKIKKALCRKDMERWTCNICVMNKTLKMIHMAILIGILWYSRFSRSFCKKQMFGISMEQASTKGMMHYLEHSSNSTIIYIYIMIYTLWFIYIYFFCVHIYKKMFSIVYRYMFSLPPKSHNVYSVYPPILYFASTPFQRLASTVEAFWRLHQLEDVARRFQPKDREGRALVMFLLARIEMWLGHRGLTWLIFSHWFFDDVIDLSRKR